MIDVAVGVVVAVVLVVAILWSQQRWRRRLQRTMTGSRQVELSALGVSAAGGFGPNGQRLGLVYPFEGGRDTLGLVVSEGRLELWGYVSRTPRRLFVLPAEVGVRYDEDHAIPAIWIQWTAPAGRGVVGFVPIRMLGLVRLAARRADISSIAHRIGQRVAPPRL